MIDLTAKPRAELGKKAKHVRSTGHVPAVLYGYKTENQSISVDALLFDAIWKKAGETSLVNLAIEGGDHHDVLIHDVDRDPVTGVARHVDFYAARLDRPIEAMIPLVFTGDSDAVNQGGVLLRVVQEVPVRALPKNLPHEIIIDTTVLATFDDRVLARDLTVGADVEVLLDDEQVISLVEPPKTEEEIAAEDAEGEHSVADIEVVGEKGKEDGEDVPSDEDKVEKKGGDNE